MEVDPPPPPPPPMANYFDPESSGRREEYRRYRKRLSSSNASPLLGTAVSKFSEARLFCDGNSIQRRPNAGLLLEDIKQEAADISDFDSLDESKLFGSGKKRASLDASDAGFSSGRQAVRSALKSVKLEEDMPHEGETTSTIFASLLDSAIQGLMPFSDVILQFERTCRNASESIRSAGTGKLRMVEDRLMQQKAQLLLDEAASWSLLWYLYGKGNEELPGELFVAPTTSHQEACRFVVTDLTAQLCLRIVLWLEGLASEALDLEKKVRGSHVGSYLPSSGVWHRTQRYIKRKNNDTTIVKHVDFDAPTREGAQLLPDDKKQDELLLEDIWTLLRAGRLEEASELCRSAGQSWRAATLCPFGGIDLFPSLEAMLKNGKSRTLQAIELESGVGRQLCLWKWASYCASEVKHALVFELCSVVLSINGLNFFIFFKFITLLCSQHIMLCKPKSEIDNIYVENC
jgi:nuclear pore complex protein Nup107